MILKSKIISARIMGIDLNYINLKADYLLYSMLILEQVM